MPVATNQFLRKYFDIGFEFRLLQDFVSNGSGTVVVGANTEIQLAEYVGGYELITVACDPCARARAQNTQSIAPCVAC